MIELYCCIIFFTLGYLHLYFSDPTMDETTIKQFNKLQFNFLHLRLPLSLVLVLEGVLILVPVVFSLRQAGEVSRAFGFFKRTDLFKEKDNVSTLRKKVSSTHLIFKMTVLFPEILYVRGVTTILPPHEGDVFAGLLQDLGPAALVTLTFDLIQNFRISLKSLVVWGWRPSVR